MCSEGKEMIVLGWRILLCFSKKIGSRDERVVNVKGGSKVLHSSLGGGWLSRRK